MASGTGWNCQAVKQFEVSSAKIPVNLRIEDGEQFNIAKTNEFRFNIAFNAARVGTFVDGIKIGADLINHRYEKATWILASAVNDIKNHWITTDGSYIHRAKVVNKLIGYYLISLAIYIIELCFWTNGKMLRGMANIVLDSKENDEIVIGLGIAGIFMYFVYLLGGEENSSASKICTN